jgi:hypothetical protein
MSLPAEMPLWVSKYACRYLSAMPSWISRAGGGFPTRVIARQNINYLAPSVSNGLPCNAMFE